MNWIHNHHSIYMSLQRLIIFYKYWKSHVISSSEAIFLSTYDGWGTVAKIKKSDWFPQITTFHSGPKTENELSIAASVAALSRCQRLDSFPLRINPLFVYLQFHQLLCLHASRSLKILSVWFLPAPKREPKGFNTLRSHSKNSLNQCWALDCVHSGHLQAAAHRELRLTGLEAWWQSCVVLAPE